MRKTRRTGALLLIIGVLLALVAGCGGSTPAANQPKSSTPAAGTTAPSTPAPAAGTSAAATPAPAPAPAPAPKPPEPVTIRLAIPTMKADSAFDLMADAMGYWKELGVTVEILENDSSVTLTQALIAGQVDVVAATPSGFLVAAEAGADLKIIGATKPKLAHVLYTPTSIKSVKDLAGKKVGTSSPLALPHQLVMLLLQDNGMDPKGIQVVQAGGSSGRIQALLAGKIEAAASTSDFNPVVMKEPGKFHVLVDFGEAMPRYIRTALMASDKAIKEKRDGLVRFMEGLSRGYRYAAENPDAFKKVAMERIKDVDEATVKAAWEDNVKGRLIVPDLAISGDSVNYMQDANVLIGAQKKKLPLTQVYDPTLQQEVQKKLGAWTWK